jgi:predicted double-glycine peptidase
MRSIFHIALLIFVCISSPLLAQSPRTDSPYSLQFEGVVKQEHDFSCGAASLATVLKYHLRIDVTEKEILDNIYATLSDQEKEEVKRLGLSAPMLRREVTRRGLEGATRIVTFDRLRQLQPAAIVRQIRDGVYHWVVLDGFSEDGMFAFIRDPSPKWGRHKQSTKQFLEQWTDATLNERKDIKESRYSAEPHGWVIEIIGRNHEIQLSAAEQSRSKEIVDRLPTYDAIVRRQTELLQKDKTAIEFGFSTARRSTPIDLGGTPIGVSRGYALGASTSVRYGLTEDSEISASASGASPHITTYTLAGNTAPNTRWNWDSGSVGYRSVLYRETPKIIGGLSLSTSLTGGPSTGEVSLAADTTIRAVTVYGLFAYDYTFGNRQTGLGSTLPRSALSYGAGTSVPISSTMAFNLGVTRVTQIHNGSVPLGSYIHPTTAGNASLSYVVGKSHVIGLGYTHSRSSGVQNTASVSYTYAF